MLLQTPMQLGPLASPTGFLGTLVIIAIVLLIGRVLMNIAWKLVLIAIAIVGGLWVLGVLGSSLGVL